MTTFLSAPRAAGRPRPVNGSDFAVPLNGAEELLRAILEASAERRAEALAVLRGEVREGPAAEPYLTLREVARCLGVSPCTLWRWQIPGHVLGGLRRFRFSEVQAYLNSESFQRRAARLRAERTKP